MIRFFITQKILGVSYGQSSETSGEQSDEQSYGLAYIDNGIKVTINDITPEREKIEFIAEVFNREQPEPIHIEEILENFLMNFTDF
ncbi:MAG: hypothetical protein IJV39_02320 [Ruminococcus sp.]|nr:hypothetical protein [Ruminococcus sp.]